MAGVQKRLPRATVVLQLDEPSMPAVIAGHVPTESGLSAYRAVDSADAATALRTITEAVGVPVIVHCCSPDVPLQVVRDAQAVAVALDLSLLKNLDPMGEALESGLGLLAGAVPTRPPANGRAPNGKQVAETVRTFWKQLAFPITQLPKQVVVTPACGLAGAQDAYVRATLKACREAARRLAEV